MKSNPSERNDLFNIGHAIGIRAILRCNRIGFIVFACVFCGLSSTRSTSAQSRVIDFEELTTFSGSGDTGSFYQGNIDGTSNAAGWTSRDVHFANHYTVQDGFSSWGGWAYSNVVDVSTPGLPNEFAALPGSGASGSQNYAIGYLDFFSDSLFVNVPESERLHSLQLTNTTYGGLSMRDGDAFAKKFGGPSGTEPDFFGVTLTGYDQTNAQGTVTGRHEFMLADFRSPDKSLDYIVDEWREVELSDIGSPRSIAFEFQSSDVHETFGINTPLYVAVDDLTFVPTEGTLGDFNGDGLLEAKDVDLLAVAIQAGQNDPLFDLTSDQRVDDADLSVWVHDLKDTYLGDSDLDGEFNSSDLVTVLTAGEYEDGLDGNSGWETGDWNGDRDFDSGDLVSAFSDGGYELGPRQAVASVPEPTTGLGGLLTIIAVLVAKRRKSTRV